MNLPYKALNAGRLISRGRGRHPVRTIDSWELILVIDSTLSMFVDQRQLEVPKGSCLLLPPQVRHGGTTDYPPKLSFFWIHFLPTNKLAETHLKQLSTSFQVLNFPRLIQHFQLFLSLQEETPDDQHALDLVLQLIMHEAFKVMQATSKEMDIPPLLQQLRNILTLRFREPLTTQSLARGFQCNPDYLGRIYKKYFGEAITDTINDKRLNHAAMLLKTTSQNIDQIAYEVGFNDLAYFRRRFLRKFAVTPHVYRKLQAQGHVNTE